MVSLARCAKQGYIAVKAGIKATNTAATGAVKAGINATKAGVETVDDVLFKLTNTADEFVGTATKAAGEKITNAANYALFQANEFGTKQLIRAGNHIVGKRVKKIPDELIKRLNAIGIDTNRTYTRRAVRAYIEDCILNRWDNRFKRVFGILEVSQELDPNPGIADVIFSPQSRALFKRYFPNSSLAAARRESVNSFYSFVEDRLGKEGMKVISDYLEELKKLKKLKKNLNIDL